MNFLIMMVMVKGVTEILLISIKPIMLSLNFRLKNADIQNLI